MDYYWLKRCNLTLTDFVFDITHQRPKSQLIGVVRIAKHSAL